MTTTPGQLKFIHLINTHSNIIMHVSNYALLQVTAIMMVVCLLCMIMIFLSLIHV